MELLASIRPEDVDPKSTRFDYATFTSRPAARVILFDGDKVALIYVSKHNYYMLPGGGIEDEDVAAGLGREILEEVGCEAKIEHEVGSIEVYFDRWHQKQVDYCYTAQKISSPDASARTEFEEEEGHQIVWAANLAEAIELVEKAAPKERDGMLVRARDLLFLKTLAAK
ncbi:MAG TPA: NUDIX domain-containing protein [Candidatus Saccharimonadales bacterium]